MALTGTLAVGMLATSVWRRSWRLWLVGMALLVGAAIVAWSFRSSEPTGSAARGASVAAPVVWTAATAEPAR